MKEGTVAVAVEVKTLNKWISVLFLKVKKRFVSYLLSWQQTIPKTIFGVNNLAWTQALWFLLLILLWVTHVAVVIWTVAICSKMVSPFTWCWLLAGLFSLCSLILYEHSHGNGYMQERRSWSSQASYDTGFLGPFYWSKQVTRPAQISREIDPTSLWKEQRSHIANGVYTGMGGIYAHIPQPNILLWKFSVMQPSWKNFKVNTHIPTTYLDSINIFLHLPYHIFIHLTSLYPSTHLSFWCFQSKL